MAVTTREFTLRTRIPGHEQLTFVAKLGGVSTSGGETVYGERAGVKCYEVNCPLCQQKLTNLSPETLREKSKLQDWWNRHRCGVTKKVCRAQASSTQNHP